ncbi:MAG: VWA domain-containing protein [Treponema sp.]|jgi:Ca-activated chloride channel family protein|nr:VWA domain-containing protein [Treponema sp.]
MSLTFEQPLWIPAGIVILIIVFLLSRFFTDLLRLEIPLGPPGGVAFKPPRNLKPLLRVVLLAEYTGALLLFTAAAGPQRLIREPVWLSRGADILFVLDSSPSMAGLDMGGRSRFDTARDLVLDFAGARGADALGLVALGSEAALVLPPTTDRDLLRERLGALRIGELGDGTALGLGLAIAALHLAGSGAPRRAVVLITDGENNAGSVHPETAAKAVRDAGASLWVIGVGTFGEVAIDYLDPVLNLRRTGHFDSRFDAGALRTIAEAGEGTYIPAASLGAFTGAFDRISGAELTVGRAGTVNRTLALGNQAILGGLLLIGLAWYIRRIILGAWL